MNIGVSKVINNYSNKNKIISFSLLLVATLLIFLIAEAIRELLHSYDLHSMFVSFCAGFILFIPLVSLVLHPLYFSQQENTPALELSSFMVNLGLVMVVQMVCFLIWMTDAVAVYSIYVDQTSFLAKAFNINAQNRGDLSYQFYWANLFLAWFFSCLSIVIGILPCIVARINNNGVVKNFVTAFVFAKKHKKKIALYALLLALTVTMTLLYAKYLFLILFPIVLNRVFSGIYSSYFLMAEQ